MKKNWVILSKNLMFLIISLSILFVFSSKAYATAADIFTTKSNVTLPNSSMSDIAYGNGVYIAVGAYGAIIKSTDADTWVNVKTKANISSYTGVGTPGSFAFYGVAYGNGVFVVGGSEGVILSSTDGITWTQRTSNITSSIGDIDYLTFNGSSAFYAMSQGKFIKSTDGITWTTVTPTGIGSTDYLTRVTVGNSGTRLAVGSSPGKIYYTINGTTWVVAQPTTPAYASGVNMLRWMNDRYFISDPSAYIWTSTDLSSFTLVGSPFKQTSSDYLNQMFTGFYDGSKYYMFGGQSPYGYGAVYTSTNATTWIMQTFSNSFVCSNSVFVNGKYFRLGNEGMLVSNDGTTWNYKWGGLFSDISYDGTKFVAVGKQGGDGAIWTSTDQQNWTNVSPVGWSKPYRAVAYGNSNYVAVGELNGTISTMATSNNGTTWTRQTGINDSSELYDIAYGSGKFVVVGAIGNVPNSTATLKYSSNGVSWTSATLPATNVSLSSITFTNNKFIALGYDNSSSAIIWTSNDGVTWTDLSASYSTSTDVLSNIIYDGNKYILLGYDTSTYELFSCSSADFSTWSSHTILGGSYSTYSYSTQIARKGSNIYILATDADLAMKIFYSNDQGQTWQDTAISTSSIFPYEVMEINNEVVISGDGQLFMTTASASNACDVTTWTTPSSPTVTGTTVTKSVGNGTSSIVVDVTVSANASWKLYSDAGCTTEIADKTMSLSVGGNTTYVKVTAEDGSTTKVYTLTATRAAAASNACDVTTWTTPISPTVTGTTVTKSVGNGTSSIVVDVTVSENASWKLYSDAGCTTEITNKTMSLGVGGNTTYVKVTAEDGSTTKVYALTVTRDAAVSNSSACDITAWTTTTPGSITITETTVTKGVGNGASSIVVDVTVSENASWKLYSDAGCTTEITNKTMILGVGGNTAYVRVTAEDGITTKVYTLTVIRDAAVINSTACNITAWTTTTPGSITITETTVTKSVGNGTSSILVDVIVSENASWKLYSDASCTNEIIDKTMSLSVGGNTAYVKVTAQDGSITKVYILTLIREAASSQSNGGSSRPSSVTNVDISTPNTVTGTVVDEKTGETVKGVTAQVTTQTDGTKTVSVKSEEAVVFKQPDGTKNAITDFSKLSFSSVVTNSTDPTGSVTNAYVTIKSDGTIAVSNLAKGTETKFEVTFDLGNGQKITIGSMNVKVSNDGSVSLTSTLIDPYGIITDAATGKIIAGVNVVLYYANTARNIANGKTPDTIVPLPTIDGFKPNNNVNPQISDANGAYGWMVFPTSDYYIVATKAGFYQYTSFTISVEQRIVKWDFRMNEKNADTSIDGVSRLAGQNRIDTSINLAKATYPGKLSNVIFATAGNFADALAGSVLAYRLSSPILLVGSSDLDQQKLLDYIKTNMDTTGMVYILGGNGVVSKQFEDKVTESGFANITRLGGADRYETSVKIAETLKVDSTTPVILASGESYPDALSISSIAAVNGYPILLVKKDEISDAVKLELAKIAPEKVFIIGLQGAVGTVVENQIPSIVGINENIVSRIGGQDRFETSLAIANGFKLDGNNICIATGNDFPDALAGSLYATKHNSPIMLVDKLLTDDAIKYVTERKTTGVMIFGGESVVNQAIQEQLTKIVSN